MPAYGAGADVVEPFVVVEGEAPASVHPALSRSRRSWSFLSLRREPTRRRLEMEKADPLRVCLDGGGGGGVSGVSTGGVDVRTT